MIENINGLNINYICEGEGKNILLLHGWGASIETVLPIFNHLKDRFKVYAVDLPGFGKSDEPKEVWGTLDYAECIRGFIRKMNMKKVTLIGHSHGGRVSIFLGNEYPNIIDKIILVDSAGLIPKRHLKYYFKVYTFKTLKKLYTTFYFGSNKEERMEKFYRKFGSTDYKNSPGIMRKVMVKVLSENLRPLLSGIKAPTLLIWGSNDEDTPVYMGEIMEKEIPDSGLVVLDNAGHYSYLDKFNHFKVIIDNFLEGSE
ncbi:alpha/beta fold hydrolase [Sporosalibacterium faouarense]|uniref:alpha/beta fold hydrolase n=1 Tax=Sporosalibacterium faouarense TaxID=516123 RepID=UPI00141D425A|nr:alpha/beta hydrolase [Sporosalibacterium faouarense]MTI46956.1 alpha/beta hydrolase [Bacillota bacterium]